MDQNFNQQLPLSPPKKILDRLTPLKGCPLSSPPSPRRSPVYRKRRTLSTGDVFEKVSKFKVETELEIAKKQSEFYKKLEKAQVNRTEVLKEKKEHARRLSSDSRIWGKFKVTADFSTANSAIEDEHEGIQVLLEDPFIEQERNEYIVANVERYLLKKRSKSLEIFQDSLDSSLKSNSWGNLIKLVTSASFKSEISITLQYFRTPAFSANLPLSNVFLYSLIMLSDHHSNSGIERAYDTTLGEHSISEYGGYGVKGFKRFHYYKDSFYSYLVSKFLRSSRNLLISFQKLIRSDYSLYSVHHLKYLSSWRNYVELFHIFTNFHLNRSLLLLLKAHDIYESAVALQEQAGIEPDYPRREFFKRQKSMLEKQIVMNQKRNSDSEHGWFTLGLSFRERVERLYQSYMNFEEKKKHLDSNLIIPPGFTVSDWRKFRLNRVLNSLGTSNVHMKSGREILEDDSVEKEIEDLGLKTFKDFAREVKEVKDVVNLVEMLFGCVGTKLSEDEQALISRYQQEDYLIQVQQLFQQHTSQDIKIVHTLKDFLKIWRNQMNHYTSKWIEQSIGLCPQYTKFELHMFKYELSKTNQSYEDFIEELRLEINKRSSISKETLLLQYIFFNNPTLAHPIKSIEHIKYRLEGLLLKLKETDNALKFLWCSTKSREVKESLMKLYDFTYEDEKFATLNELKQVIQIHLYTYDTVYDNITN